MSAENTLVYNFKDQLAMGKKGEEKVFEYLRQRPETIKLDDLSGNANFQSLGIDAEWVYKNEETGTMQSVFFDVKTDYIVHKNGKLFIETNSSNLKKGCMLTTFSEYFYYYDPFHGKLYIISIYPLRNWYKRKGIAKKHIPVTNEKYEGEGISLTISELEEMSALHSVIDIGALTSLF